MAEYGLGWITGVPDGEHFAPEVRKEIAHLAPINVPAGGITEEKLGTQAVSSRALAEGAVGPTKIAAQAVGNGQLANGAVNADKLAANAVTADKAGAGVMRARNETGDPIPATIVPMSSTTYASITPDPDTFYATWT